MAYDSTKPTDDEYLSAFPAEMREQLRSVIEDEIVNALRLKGYSPGNLTGNIPLNNGNLNTNLNADQLDGHDATYFSADGHVHTAATQSANGFMTNTDKAKLDGIATGAEVNQNAFSNVVVGSTTIQADNKTDALTFEAGANIAITPDATNDKVNIAVTGTVPTAAVAGRAISDEGGKIIADTYFAKSGGTINGDITANQIYANGEFRTIGATGWYSETFGGGWYMEDTDWIRARNGKSIYTTGRIKTEDGFYGALHGTADNATNAEKIGNDNTYMRFHWSGQAGQPTWLWGSPNDGANSYVYNPVNFDVHSAGIIRPLSGDANYKLAYTADGQRTNAGEWGRVVMRYDPNGQTYGVRVDRADYADSAGSVSGWSVDTIKRNLGGRNQPTLTSILDGCYDANGNKINKIVNAGTGISGYGTGDIHLTQSYKNFDKILVVLSNDDTNYIVYMLWDTWQLAYTLTHGWRVPLQNAAGNSYWEVWPAVQSGTSTHPLSTDTVWYLCNENSVLVDIIGVNY